MQPLHEAILPIALYDHATLWLFFFNVEHMPFLNYLLWPFIYVNFVSIIPILSNKYPSGDLAFPLPRSGPQSASLRLHRYTSPVVRLAKQFILSSCVVALSTTSSVVPRWSAQAKESISIPEIPPGNLPAGAPTRILYNIQNIYRSLLPWTGKIYWLHAFCILELSRSYTHDDIGFDQSLQGGTDFSTSERSYDWSAVMPDSATWHRFELTGDWPSFYNAMYFHLRCFIYWLLKGVIGLDWFYSMDSHRETESVVINSTVPSSGRNSKYWIFCIKRFKTAECILRTTSIIKEEKWKQYAR